jgi:hypothetical protein
MEHSSMKTPSRKRIRRQRKCRHCGKLYTPDHRNRWHQKYCFEPPCREASKKAAQRRWYSSEKGRDYFQGPENVGRVQRWRAQHPGYWKRSGKKLNDALQDVLSSQAIVRKEDTQGLNANALQDICSPQPALLIGLIASLTGTTLQDQIAETSRRFLVFGQDILGIGPGGNLKGGRRDGDKTHSLR